MEVMAAEAKVEVMVAAAMGEVKEGVVWRWQWRRWRGGGGDGGGDGGGKGGGEVGVRVAEARVEVMVAEARVEVMVAEARRGRGGG